VHRADGFFVVFCDRRANVLCLLQKKKPNVILEAGAGEWATRFAALCLAARSRASQRQLSQSTGQAFSKRAHLTKNPLVSWTPVRSFLWLNQVGQVLWAQWARNGEGLTCATFAKVRRASLKLDVVARHRTYRYRWQVNRRTTHFIAFHWSMCSARLCSERQTVARRQ